jgi:hypothetical protein
MRPASPAACLAAHARNLAGSFESDVREAGAFFPIIEQNKPKIFGQIDKIEFT